MTSLAPVQMAEVEKIFNHRSDTSGNFTFEVKWIGGNEKEWVRDEDCQCEWLISEYLKGKNVTTSYLFCRVSTKNQASNTCVSLAAQESELRGRLSSLVKCCGRYNRVRSYSISASAYTNIPTTLSRIGEAAQSGDSIYVWRVDRLSRNIVKYLSWCEDMKTKGVELVAHQEGLTYSANKLNFIQCILNANRESEDLGKRVKLSIEYKKARGDEKVGGLPYGKKYHRLIGPDFKTLKMIVVNNIQELETINVIKSRYASDNGGWQKGEVFVNEIATDLNNSGITKRGKQWTSGMIRNVCKL
jgi:DNA invertase Pin-like site-specific DNA recombinase